MSATTYILTGGAGTNTHIDLGLKVGALSLEGQTITVKGSAGNNSFFLRPGGYTFDFRENGGGTDKIYLTGRSFDYRVFIDPDTNDVTIRRHLAEGEAAETIIIPRSSDVTVVFAEGFILASSLVAVLPLQPTTDTETSLEPNLPTTIDGGVRVAALGADGDTNVFNPGGPTITAFGNGGVDQVFVAAGAKVDASDLGRGEDKIFLEGTWESYDKSYVGSRLTLTREVVNVLTGATQDEEVTVVGGFGAANDRLYFANGSASTRDLLVAVRDGRDNVVTQDDRIWNSEVTSFSSAAVLDSAGGLALTADTGAAGDGVTSNGEVTVSGVADGYRWQYSVDGGGFWETGTGDSFTLDGQMEGATGVTYAAGQVQVRQVNPFGVPSPAVSNAQDIIVDTATIEPSFSALVSGITPGSVSADRISFETEYAVATGLTVQFWFYVDDLSARQQLTGSGFPVQIRGNADGQLGYYVSGNDNYDLLPGVKAVEGWNFVSISSAAANTVEVTIVNARSPQGATATGTGYTTSESTVGNPITVTLGSTSSGSHRLNGVIRDVAVWTGSRDLSTVVNDSTNPPAAGSSGLINYWALNEAAGATPAGVVSNGPALTLAGNAETGQFVSAYFPGADGQATSSLPLIMGEGAEAFATITITRSGSQEPVGTTTADGSGRWRFVFPQAQSLATGDHTITATARDTAGNETSTTVEITVDASIPLTPTLEAASDTGTAGDNITSARTPTLSGTLPDGTASGTEVIIWRNGIEVATVTETATPADGLTVNFEAGPPGTWEFTPPADLDDGEHAFVVSVGGVSSAPLTVTVDQNPGYVTADSLFDTALATNNSASADNGGAVLDHDFKSNATVSAWVYIADPTGAGTNADQLIFHTSFDLTVELQRNSGQLHVFRAGFWRNSNIVIEEAGWYHMTVTDNPDGIMFYIDGDAFDSPRSFNAGAPSGATTPTQIGFGRFRSGGQRALDGAFRDIQVWDRTLSAEEVEAARNGAVNFDDPDLVGYWAMDHSSGFTNAVTGGPDLTAGGAAAIELRDEQLIEATALEDGNLVVRGRLSPDIVTLDVALSGGAAPGPSVSAVIDAQKGAWTATFTPADLAQLSDGAALNVTLDGTDVAGNANTTVIDQAVTLEIINTNPTVSAPTIDPVMVAFGTAGGTQLLDLTNLPGGGAAFADADTAGSANATLTYSAALAGGGDLPGWLRMTPEGVFEIWDNETAADIGGEITVTVTVTDGSGDPGATVQRDIVFQMPKLPVLDPASDSGVVGDNITNVATPKLSGELPPGLASGTTVAIEINGAPMASGSETTADPAAAPPGTLILNYDTSPGTWEYTPSTDLLEGDNEIVIVVGDIASAPLTVTVDQTVTAPDIDTPFRTALHTNQADSSVSGGARLDHAFTDNSMTVGAWVYLTEEAVTGSVGTVFSSALNTMVTINSIDGSGVTMRVNGDWLQGDAGEFLSIGLPTVGWHYVAWSVTPGAAALYYDDQMIEMAAPQGFLDDALGFGHWVVADASALDGAYRDIRVWDRALSAEEIAAARDGVIDPTDEGLVGHWPLDGASGLDNEVAGGPALTLVGEAAFNRDMITTSSFDGDDLVLSGALAADITHLRVILNDAAAGEQAKDAVINAENRTWSVSFTLAEMEMLSDGALTFTLEATDIAGNMEPTVFTDPVQMEIVNEAPQLDQPMPVLVAGAGAVGVTGGTVLLDVTDLPDGGAAFVDNDVPGSVNAALTYSAAMADGSEWPTWLEMTADGRLLIVDGATVPEFGEFITIAITAMDGASESVSTNVTINSALALTSVVHGETEVDVRSSVTLESRNSEDTIKFADSGTYTIELVQTADSVGKTGFDGNIVDGSQTMTVTLAGGVVTSSTGGTVEIVNGKAVISFAEHFDLSTNFSIAADAGLFVSNGNGLSSDRLVAGQVNFATVTPNATPTGQVAQTLNASTGAFEAGDSWFDGTGGEYADMANVGLNVDLSDVTGIVAMGHDTDTSSHILLNASGRTRLTGFGGDDLIYIDRPALGPGHVENDLSVDEITMMNNGTNTTTLTFSGVNGLAGVLITFADDDTTALQEHQSVADSFVDTPGQLYYSFDHLTGNGQPVISG